MTLHIARSLTHLLVAFLLCVPALAQDAPVAPDAPEKERRKAAKAEKRERREAEKAAKATEAAGGEEAIETERREKAGLDAADVIPEEEKGFLLRLEAFSAEVGGADRTVARLSDIVTAATTAEELDTDRDPVLDPGFGLPDAFSTTNERPVELSYDSDLTFELEIGWRFENRAALSVRHWSVSQGASVDVAAGRSFPLAAGGPGLSLGGIDNVGIENVSGAYAANPAAFDRPFGSPTLVVSNRLHGADRIVASGEFEASRIDLLYSKAGLARKRIELFYRTGITMASIERSEAATLTWTSFSQSQVALATQSIETIQASCSTDGFGVTVGIASRFDFTADRRWGVRVGLDVAGVFAQHELAFRDAAQLSQAGLPPPPEQVFHDTRNDGGSHLLTILDGELAFEGRFRRFQVSLGYNRSEWLSALSQERYPSAANTAQLEQRVLDVDFSGPFLRLGFFF